MSWDALRREFPALRNYTYLNTATFGQIPTRSLAAMQRHFERRNALACTDFIDWFIDMDRVRAALGELVGCAGRDIAFFPNASTALSLFLGGIAWQAGDEILSMEGEFPNQLYYPAHLAPRGVELKIVPCGALLESLTPRTRAVAISTVNYSNGYTAPLAEIGRALRQRGILFFLDGTQSVGALRIDLGTVRPDMFAVHAYKWMLSPNGAAWSYVSPELRRVMDPSVIGWRSDRDWRAVNALHRGSPRFSEDAERYEGGMLNFSSIYAMGETVDMLLETGTARIEERVLSLAARVREVLEREGGRVAYTGSPIVAAEFPDRDLAALASGLKERGILTAARHGRLRVSPHFYNNEADIDLLAQGLARMR